MHESVHPPTHPPMAVVSNPRTISLSGVFLTTSETLFLVAAAEGASLASSGESPGVAGDAAPPPQQTEQPTPQKDPPPAVNTAQAQTPQRRWPPLQTARVRRDLGLREACQPRSRHILALPRSLCTPDSEFLGSPSKIISGSQRLSWPALGSGFLPAQPSPSACSFMRLERVPGRLFKNRTSSSSHAGL